MPGHIYFFKGLGKGQYAQRTKLVSPDGRSISVGDASAVAVADWNRDGLPDLVIGNIDGEVWLVANESRDGKLVFGSKHKLSADGRNIHVVGDAGPFVVDWDADGIPDLLLGANDGSVTFYRGSGKTGEPSLKEDQVLVPPLPEDMSHAITIQCELDPSTGHLRAPHATRPWIRTKPAVFDWNGDGKPDLLVGDLVYWNGPEPVLSDEQKKEKAELDAKAKLLSKEQSAISLKAQNQALADINARVDRLNGEDRSDQIEERWTEILSKDEHYRDLRARGQELWKRGNLFRAEFSAHGFVWVYLRK